MMGNRNILFYDVSLSIDNRKLNLLKNEQTDKQTKKKQEISNTLHISLPCKYNYVLFLKFHYGINLQFGNS